MKRRPRFAHRFLSPCRIWTERVVIPLPSSGPWGRTSTWCFRHWRSRVPGTWWSCSLAEDSRPGTCQARGWCCISARSPCEHTRRKDEQESEDSTRTRRINVHDRLTNKCATRFPDHQLANLFKQYLHYWVAFTSFCGVIETCFSMWGSAKALLVSQCSTLGICLASLIGQFSSQCEYQHKL